MTGYSLRKVCRHLNLIGLDLTWRRCTGSVECVSYFLSVPPLTAAFRPDMFVLGFQEIVPLTAQQIVQTDPEKR
jgi:hypothetical protein